MTDEYDADQGSAPLIDGSSDDGTPYEPGRRRSRKRRSVPGCLAVIVALAVIVGGFYFVVTWGIDKIGDQFSSADDYPGPGHGNVTFQVHSGDTAAVMGRNLKSDGVVASVEAFIDAANADPESNGIQAGYFPLKKEMAAADVVDVLVDPSNMVKDTVTFPEGLRVVDMVKILAEQTDYSKKDFEKVLDKPDKLGLPDYADGNPEGYLFPATYDFGPDATPESMLTDMVDRWRQAAEDADLEAAAADLGYTPQELMTVASLVEAEGRGDDMPKIARAIYNRLQPDNTETNGLLQIDATVNYALGRNLGVALTEEDLAVDSPYNTRLYPGLPPGPIEAPGDDAINAALNPAEGPWYYWVTVNLKTGETKFATTLDEFNEYKAEFLQYCETSEAC
ncbi:endolytic transglycosylase MltG [Nocardioides sp. YIM 152315]|uniref:endolytic transglycosylase MltG n=1 Tax=Nocardioides sp. YIM 152315 TaxID=3031760 RepID=UPI0023D9CBDB|nr:endolytic transglycosylase MltG [Nocardioides sp. YIM 152315]MDF1605604.1 endolytic transglycosylase MltG [Nocardioides sp. YIM 152315]